MQEKVGEKEREEVREVEDEEGMRKSRKGGVQETSGV